MAEAERLASTIKLSERGRKRVGRKGEPLRSLKLEADEPLLLSLSLVFWAIPIRPPKPWG
jgi:hypothetical protein